MSVQAVIEFIGIMVLAGAPASRPTLPNRPAPNAGVVAIIPRINLPQNVPPHTAAIVYTTSSGSISGNWAGNAVPIQRGEWSYLPLDGDQLTFITGLAPTKPPTRPTTLDRLRKDWETYNSGLPKLDLDPGYSPAKHYAKAAAVARLTDGTLNGCHSMTHSGRTETTARIDTNGYLTIVSNRYRSDGSLSQWGTLRLDLSQNATFAIVNVPTVDLEGTATAATGNHYLAYCAMANQSIDCPIPLANPPDPCPTIDIALPEFSGAPMTMTSSAPTPARLKELKTPLYRVVVGPRQTRKVVKVGRGIRAMSADCSNTTWP